MKFKVGDRVICKSDYNVIKKGMEGVVKHITESIPSIGVEWDKKIDGTHYLNGNINNNKGYYVYEGDIELIESSKPKDTIYFRDLLENKENICKDMLLWLINNYYQGISWDNSKRNDPKASSNIHSGYDTISLLAYIKEKSSDKYDTVYAYLKDNGYMVEEKTARQKEIEELKERIRKLEEQDNETV